MSDRIGDPKEPRFDALDAKNVILSRPVHLASLSSLLDQLHRKQPLEVESKSGQLAIAPDYFAQVGLGRENLNLASG